MEQGVSIQMVSAFLMSLILSFTLMPILIRLNFIKRRLEISHSSQHVHDQEWMIPLIGGVGIFSAFMISFLMWGNSENIESYPFLVAGLCLLFLLGIDDKLIRGGRFKYLMIQILAAAEVVIGGNVVISDMNGLLGLEDIPWFWGMVLTMAIFVFVMNAFRLIDGIDGLAGGVGIIVSSLLGIWFWTAGFIALSVLSLSLTGALIGFLIFNVYPAEIALGNTGSIVMGFILTYLSVEFIAANELMVGSNLYLQNSIVFITALLIIPVSEALKIIYMKLNSGSNLLKEVQFHSYHVLLKIGLSVETTSFGLWMANLVIIMIAFYLNFISANIIFAILIIGGLLTVPIMKISIDIIDTVVNKIRYLRTQFYQYLLLQKEMKSSKAPESKISQDIQQVEA